MTSPSSPTTHAEVSTKPNPIDQQLPGKTPNREEGELSSDEQEILTVSAVTKVVSPTPVATEKTIPTVYSTTVTSLNKYPQGSSIGKYFHAGNPISTSDFVPRSTVNLNSHNIFQQKQLPLKSGTSKWYAPPGSKDNLVIRFSDDDSGSDSEEYEQEKDSEPKSRLDNMDANRRPDTFSFTRSELLQQPMSNETKRFPSCTTVSLKNKCNGANSRGAGPLIFKQRGSHCGKSTAVNRNLLNQEYGSKQGAVSEYDKLQDLRQQIEMRENELKLTSIRPNRKIVPASVRGDNSLSLSDMIKKRRADSSDVTQSGQEGTGKKRLKVGKSCSNGTTIKKQPVKSGVKSGLQNQKKVEYSFPNKNLSGAIQSSTTTWQKQDREQELASMENTSFQSSGGFEIDANCSRSGINTRLGGSNCGIAQSLNQDSSDLRKLNAGMHGYNTTRSNEFREIQYDDRLLKPALGCVRQEHPFQNADGKFGSSNVHLENTTIQGQLSNEDLLGPTSMTLQSFLALEEMQDKELDEAQEIRRRCEIEERKAFKAYRRAQRALLEANTRCSYLYRQRELYSARFQSLFIEESDSTWSPWLHERVGNATNAVNNPFGSHTDREMPTTDHTQVQRDNASPGGYGTNVRGADAAMCQRGNQIIERQLLGLAECTEPVGGTSELQLNNRNVVNRVCSLSSDPITSVDEGEAVYSSDHESLKTNDGYQENGEKQVIREKDFNNNSVGKFPDGDSQDSILLEAHLRSKLFARLGNRTLTRNGGSGAHSGEHSVEIEAEDDVGSERTQTSAEKLSHAMVDTSQHSKVEVDPVDYRVAQWSAKSSIRCAFDHVKFSSPRSSIEIRIEDMQNHKSDVCYKEDDDTSLEKTECSDLAAVAILPNVEDAFLKKIGSYSCDLDVDPFWPLCMYELRGKCNDEQCCWQHFKDFENGSKKPANDTPKSGLVQSIIQPSRESVCTSLAVSRLLQINLPAKEDSGRNLHIQAHERWNWQSSYFQSGGRVNLINEDAADTILSLEKAILVLNQEVDESEGVKKALMVLSRALEVDSTSAILWVPYLLIYYINKKAVGNDDMFLVAVDNNEASFDLWLLYINSRMQLDNRLVAYENALSALCRYISASDGDATYTSSVVLDLVLQVLDLLCMSGHEGKAIQRIRGFFPTAMSYNPLSPSLNDILNCLTLPDKCMLWVSCVYLLIYRKLPENILFLFEFEKELLAIEWPSIDLRADEKQEALELMNIAAQSVNTNVNIESRNEATLKSLYYFALSHIRCTLLLEGLESSINLLEKYVKLYPSCLELVLQSARQQCKESFVVFEEALVKWPKEVPGIQCIWNQYAEYALEKGRVDLAKEVMVRWYESIRRMQCPQNGNFDTMNCDNSLGSLELASISNQEACMLNFDPLDKMFGWLNLGMLRVLQNDYVEAQIALDNGMRAAPPEYYKHCVREHAKFMQVGTELNDDASITKLANSLNAYVADSRASKVSKLLSRKFIQIIEKPRVGQLVDNMLSPISSDCSVINLVLEAWFGPSLLPHKFSKIKDLVNFVEAIIKFSPTNYQFALSVCKYVRQEYNNADAASPSFLFWASFLLVNAIFQSVPVAPEFIWIEASSILSQQAESTAISKMFHDRALSVYPFSVKLWKSNLSICEKTKGNTSYIIEAAKEMGINLS